MASAADRLIDSVLRHHGESITVDGNSLTGVFAQPVVPTHTGPGDARRPAPLVQVRSSDITGLTPRTSVQARGVDYLVVSIEPDDGGMTTLHLRKQ